MEQDDRQVAGSVDDCHHGETVDILAATTKSLVAIGVAAALNYHAYLRRLIPVALNNGILADEVAAALGVAGEIRTRAGVSTDNLGTALVMDRETRANGAEPVRGCCQEAASCRSTRKPGPGPRDEVMKEPGGVEGAPIWD